ncbi:hypothetical protein [Brevibacillus centrosporus]|uniref:Uncharacterized protein n=1 Tax=Brevibacillus centrosporus TaxID=54910 RepID=A0A1I4AKY3_9BACL|nr:hypothetical protein [Brevibacillus centrosporus]MED4910707.1 hypothetical protein [Brevibacillus centrosporus]SFK57128.1 hypothetical protein SAMN05518846_115119 [Brevibacillus centrosporus]
MSLSNIPDITPNITLKREDVIHLLLASIAMEEISLSHIMNAEGERIQHFLEKDDVSLEDLLRVNQSVERMLRSIVSKQILSQFKLDNILELESQVRESERQKGDDEGDGDDVDNDDGDN